jgi:septum formation protein
MKHILYLASQSPSRKRLLQEAGIPFQVLEQSANEQACDWTLPLEQLVESIAVHKMESLCMQGRMDSTSLRFAHHERPLALSPSALRINSGEGCENTIWVLTADTLGADAQGRIYAKPNDYQDAVNQLKSQRDQWVRVATGFCIERKRFEAGRWQTEERFSQTVISQILFSIEDHEIDEYIEVVGALKCAGSIAIDGFGGQYFKALNGSYSSVIGLPLYEVRQALKKTGFFDGRSS